MGAFVPQAVIATKRDGARLERRTIDATVRAACDGLLGPEQLGALLMAIYLRGLDDEEYLTYLEEHKDEFVF